VGEDSTFMALLEPVPQPRGAVSLWVAGTGIVTAGDPRYVAAFGWRPADVAGASLTSLLSLQSLQVRAARLACERRVSCGRAVCLARGLRRAWRFALGRAATHRPQANHRRSRLIVPGGEGEGALDGALSVVDEGDMAGEEDDAEVSSSIMVKR
jgi:hypothetical protein